MVTYRNGGGSMATYRHGGYRDPRDRGFYLGETKRMVYPLNSQYRVYPCQNTSSVIEKRAFDREPGELSSSSGSDEPGPRSVVMGKQNGGPVRTEKKENLTKKRKYTPIMTGNELSVNKTLETLAPLAPQTELSDMLAVSPQHSGMGDGENELGQIEEGRDFYTVARTISTSRWADNTDMDIVAPEKKKPISPMVKNTTKKVQSRSCVSDPAQFKNRSDQSSVRGYESEFSREETPGPSNPPKRRISMLQGCRNVDEFERLNKINEGTYGVVYRARDKKTGEVVALKKLKMEREKDGFPMTSLREINILLSLNHPSIVDLKEVVMGSSLDSIFMVMEYMEHDLKGVMDTMKQPYSQSEVKCLMLQLLEGVSYLHHNWILHRDLKTSNLLLDNCGNLKICDFGLARQYGSPLKPYTQLVVTLWYRAPELLLGAKEYSTAIDMWSVGCILAELLSKQPLFDGRSETEQVNKIFSVLGSPNEKIWPGYKNLPGAKVAFQKQPYNRLREKFSPTSFSGRPMLSEAGFDLLNKLLTYDPEKRITAEEALRHPWFSEVPLPKSKDFLPTFPAHNDKDRTVRQRVMKCPDPIEEQRKAAMGREPWRVRLG